MYVPNADVPSVARAPAAQRRPRIETRSLKGSIYDLGSEPITCALLDFSVTGVRLELPDNVPMPDQVKVLIGELAHNARIVWRKDATVGVDFVDEHHSIF